MSINFNDARTRNLYKDFNYENIANAKNTTNPYKIKQFENDTLDLSEKIDKYSANDGKISPKEKFVNFAKGIISPITSMFKSPKNLIIGAVSIAGVSALTIATGGAIAPLLITSGVVGGGIQLVKSAIKAHNATTDDEACAAWQGLGAGTTAVVGSFAGAKAAAKGAGIANAENMNAIEATIACIKNSPKAISKSFNAFASGKALVNLGIKNQTKADAEKIQIEAKQRLELEEETKRAAEKSQEEYKQYYEKDHANKSAEESAKAFEELLNEQEVSVEQSKQQVEQNVIKKSSRIEKVETAAETQKTGNLNNQEAITMDNIAPKKILSEEQIRQFYKEKYNIELNEKQLEVLTDMQNGKLVDGIGSKADIETLLDPMQRKQGVCIYSHGGVQTIQGTLRRGEDCPSAEIIDLMFEQLPKTTEEFEVYRGVMGYKEFPEIDGGFVQRLLSLKKGEKVTDLGYSYASFKSKIARGYSEPGCPEEMFSAFLKIKVPKGAKVSYNKMSRQAECLFPRNSQFRVLEPATTGEGTAEILLEYILPNE